ncbi:MAG: hypothetical protein WA213_09065 [Terriglobales bacterium]
MPLALLLSPDDQAVSAITSVLEEMSVSCERPLDGASAAQKLNSNRFDLVLVDCENLAAAKLIFDVCRNRKGGGRPVPVAVVDGRAGLPTAFRLGAELILTKPVAKDQARITIRTAISRVKKEDSLQTEDASTQNAQTATSAGIPEGVIGKSADFPGDASDRGASQERALAASAAAGPSLTSFSDPVAFSAASSASAPPASMTMSTAAAEPEVVEADSARQSGFTSTAGTTSETDESHTVTSTAPRTLSQASARAASRTSAKDAVPAQPVESKPTPDAKATVAEKSPAQSEVKAEAKSPVVVPSDPGPEEKLTSSDLKSEKRDQKQGQKSHGLLVTLLVLLVACGGFYAAWTYEPGFQALTKSQINHLLVVLGIAPQPQQHQDFVPLKPAVQGSKPSPGIPVPTIAPDAVQPSQTTAGEPNAPGATSTPASSSPTSTALPSPNSGAPAAASPFTTIDVQPSSNRPKSGVTRIELPPNAVEHPAATSGAKAAPKSPPPQR